MIRVKINCNSNTYVRPLADGISINRSYLVEEIKSQYHSASSSIVSFQDKDGKSVVNFHSDGKLELRFPVRDCAVALYQITAMIIDAYNIGPKDNDEVVFQCGVRRLLSVSSVNGIVWSGEQTDDWKLVLEHISTLQKFGVMT